MNIGFSVIDDLVYEGNKSFTVVLSEPTPSAAGTIDMASNTHIGTATIVEDDPEPAVLEVAAVADVDEGSANKPTFTISSDDDLGTGFIFRYQITQSGNVLTSSTYCRNSPIELTKDFTESNGRYVTSIALDIVDDNDDEVTGAITLTLLDAVRGTTGNYIVSTTKPSAIVRVYDDEVPALEISGLGTVTEGPNAKARFDVTSRFSIASSILFRYLPDDGVGSFLNAGIAGNPQIGRLDFNGTQSASLEVPIYDDAIAEENGEVSVELLGETGGIFNYTVGLAPTLIKPQ